MRIRCFFLLSFLSPMALLAQFIYNPLPLQQADFARINQLKYTKCLVYKLEGENRILVKEAEYGNMGMIAVLYEKGTDDDGDSMNVATTYYKFNGKGKLVQKEDSDEDFDDSKSVYTYDATGRLIKKQVVTIDPPTYTYKYDGKGKLIQVNIVQRFPEVDKNGESTGKAVDMPTYKYTYKYNAKEQLAEQWEYKMADGKFELGYKFTWTYDDKGRVIATKRLDADGKMMNEAKYEYNAEGLLSKSIEKDDFAGPEDVVCVYEYNREKQSWAK